MIVDIPPDPHPGIVGKLGVNIQIVGVVAVAVVIIEILIKRYEADAPRDEG